jgi:hypothetical protein
VLAVVAAVTLRAFWRQIIEMALISTLFVVFVGVITIVTQGRAALGR